MDILSGPVLFLGFNLFTIFTSISGVTGAKTKLFTTLSPKNSLKCFLTTDILLANSLAMEEKNTLKLSAIDCEPSRFPLSVLK